MCLQQASQQTLSQSIQTNRQSSGTEDREMFEMLKQMETFCVWVGEVALSGLLRDTKVS